MKTIGLLGGMSWESSALYYRLVNQLVQEQLGGLHSARCIMASIDFADIEALQSTGQWDVAGDLLADTALGLEAAGADMIVLCTNTMHKVSDVIAEAVEIPLLHLADVTAQAVIAAGLKTVGLLGTAFTMEQDFYLDRIAGHGLEILIPEAEQRHEVHRVIYEELVRGVISEDSRNHFVDIIAELAGRGAEGIILGCTEIELLISQEASPLPVFATTQLHAEAAVRLALED
ncbi:aspartate/glutamate racemase family protein [Arthrobacter psychrolactophilus]